MSSLLTKPTEMRPKSTHAIFNLGDEIQDSGGRHIGTLKLDSNVSESRVLYEWKPSLSRQEAERTRQALLKLPTDEDINRREEARTLKIIGFAQVQFCDGRAAIYDCDKEPINLRDVIRTQPKPSTRSRQWLAAIIVTQIRSLHVHFDLVHGGLRLESFVFFGDPKTPDLQTPYLLDWGRRSVPGLYEYPDYKRGKHKLQWFHDAWAMMIILIGIAEWKPIKAGVDNMTPRELFVEKLRLMRLVQKPEWKGEHMAEIMQYGFCAIKRGTYITEMLAKKVVKRYYDVLYELFVAEPKKEDSMLVDMDIVMV